MNKILKESYIYKFLLFLKNMITKLFEKSAIVQGFLNNKYKDENYSAINEILAMIIHKYGYDKAKEKLINLLSDDISIG